MFTLRVNSKVYEAAKDGSLIDYLRYELKLTSVKNGCSAGACGACMILVDAKAVRACLLKVSGCAGKSVETVEGLSEFEREAYAYAFGEAGAVQCGFCIPGMVISAKALLNENKNPTREDVKKAIKPNICRCTGYVKIEDAVLLAADVFRKGIVPISSSKGKLGEHFTRIDSREKTLGTGIYVDDISLEGMLFAKALRPKEPRMLIKSIDASKALAHPDCIAVFSAKDVPGKNKMGHLANDWDAFIPVGLSTRYIGDSIALAVCTNAQALDEVLNLIEVDCEALPVISSPEMALADGAPLLHEGGNILKREVLKRGDADTAIKNSAHVVTNKYSLPFTDHAFMEPECAIAQYDGQTLLLYSGGQSVYDEQREIASLLGLPKENVRCVSKLVGGGFGGKEDMSVQHHAALAAFLLKKPVKVRFTRQESLNVHPKRHAMELEFTTACDENGMLTGMKATVVSDTGAYASLGGPVLQRACTHAAGPYNYENVEITGTAVYTNNPPGGAFRGFGVTQTAFATECNLNALAQMVGISPYEIRYRNAIRPGQTLPNGQLADETTALVECLEAVKPFFESEKYVGIASSFKNSGLGVGVPDYGRCIISVDGGKVHIRTSAACIGQGMGTITTQIVCQITGLTPELIVADPPDTHNTPDSGTTTASRQTFFTGEATAIAARKLLQAMVKKQLNELEGQEFYGEFTYKTDSMNSQAKNPVSHATYGYAAQVVAIDEKGQIKKVVAAYDAGQIVNPKAFEGQIEGGVVMGLGYALSEDFPLDNGQPKVKYGTLGLLRATQVPAIEIINISEVPRGQFALGAKGVGELATIPTAPAVQAAYYKLDGVFRTKLPLKNTFYKKG